MRRLIGVVILALAAPLLADDKEKADGFAPLFNGKNFAGWRFSGGKKDKDAIPKNWKVEKGVIHLTGGGNPHLASQWEYEDFDLRFEWRSLKDNYNSGLFIRSGRDVGANQINLAKAACGGFIGGKMKGHKPVPEMQKPPKEWNEWRVLCQGDKVTFWVNGKLAWEGTELPTKRGYLGLQAEGAAMEFRNLRIKEFDYEDISDLKGWNNDDHWKADGAGFASDGKAAKLTLKKPPRDYVLKLEWKADKDATPELLLHGKSVPLAAGKLTPHPVGEWNYSEVRVASDKATPWLNGTVGLAHPVAGKEDSIVLNVPEGALHVRNVRIKREASPK